MKQFNLSLALLFSMFVLNTYGQLNPDPNGGPVNQQYALRLGSTSVCLFSNKASNANGNQLGLDFITNNAFA